MRLKLGFSVISNGDKPALAVYAARRRGKEVRLPAIFQGRIDNRYNARFVKLDDLRLALAAEIHRTVGTMNESRQMIIVERHPVRAIEPPKAALGEYDRTIKFVKPFDNPLRNFDIGPDLQIKIRDTRVAGSRKMLGILDRHKNGGLAHLPQRII